MQVCLYKYSQIKLTYVGFRAHVKIASRIVNSDDVTLLFRCAAVQERVLDIQFDLSQCSVGQNHFHLPENTPLGPSLISNSCRRHFCLHKL